MAKLIWKIVIIGDPAVGKTSIRKKYLGETTVKEYIYTIGADFASKRIKLSDDLIIQYQIFDLAGQPKFDKVRASFYAGAQVAVLVYDITDNNTLKNLPKWVKEAMRNNDNTISTFVVVGNKIDLREEKKTDDELLKSFIDDLSREMGHGILHIYTSALTGENIDLLFQKITEKLLAVASKQSPELANLVEAIESQPICSPEPIETKSQETFSIETTESNYSMKQFESDINNLKSEINEIHNELNYLKDIVLKLLQQNKKILNEFDLKEK